jgi:hypothetical protein
MYYKKQDDLEHLGWIDLSDCKIEILVDPLGEDLNLFALDVTMPTRRRECIARLQSVLAPHIGRRICVEGWHTGRAHPVGRRTALADTGVQLGEASIDNATSAINC